MSTILGLDISTSCVGWCILDAQDGSVIAANAIALKDISCMFEKAQRVKESFLALLDDYTVDSVAIEENLQAFRPGFSSAKTIVTLARFNGIVSWLSYKCMKVEPSFINVNRARKSVGLKIDRKSSLSTKEQIFEWVRTNHMEDYPWPTKTLKSGPRKGLVIFDDSCYDISDAFVIARANVNNE
jgi:Holliday junction resolvasome RuvABC endonuclease subunit